MNQMQLSRGMLLTSLWTIITVIAFIVRNTWIVSNYKAKVDEAIKGINWHIKDEEKIRETIKSLERKVDWNEVKFAQMQVDIQWIKAMLLDIRQDQKNSK